MASSGGGRVMEKPITSQDQRSAVLRCPRCDSSNTKFCYYNNYSLTQPRHFCKACKRYWTRGGTLRNVPVGGGCRKNKRIKKPTSSSTSDNPTTTPIASHNLHHHKIPKAGNQVNSLFFGLPNQLSHDINLSTIPRFHLGENITTTLPLNSSSTSTTNSFHDHHLQPQFNSMGLLGFSSITDLTSGSLDHNYQNRFSTITTSNNSIIPNFSLLGTSSSLSTSTPPMTSSLLASTLNQQQKLNLGGLKEFTRVPTNYLQDLSTPFEGIQMVGNISDPSIVGKGDNKIEEEKNKEDWGSSSPFGASVELNGSSDPSLYWNSTNVHGANWTDLSNNYGSSVTPLI